MELYGEREGHDSPAFKCILPLGSLTLFASLHHGNPTNETVTHTLGLHAGTLLTILGIIGSYQRHLHTASHIVERLA